MITETKRAVERGILLRVRCPDWFCRDDFWTWRSMESRASWDHGAKRDTTEYSDVFMTFDGGAQTMGGVLGPACFNWEGSDTDGLPDDIYRALGQIIADQTGGGCGVIWLVPV